MRIAVVFFLYPTVVCCSCSRSPRSFVLFNAPLREAGSRDAVRESKWVRMVVYECATDLWFARAFREFVRETTPLDRPLGVLFFLTPPPKTGLDSLDSTI